MKLIKIKTYMLDWGEEKGKRKVFGATSRRMILLGVPQGFSPPEKLGKFKHIIDLMLYLPKKKSKY